MKATKFGPSQVHLYQPPPNSHKGQNGKLLVIGGSRLFHSSIFWSADIASRIVDLVHLTSPANENNQIFRKRLKEKFWSGIVVDWGDVESYIEEDDCILIGPGMIRDSEKEGKEGKEGSEGTGGLDHPALRPSESLAFRRSESSEFSEKLAQAAKTDKTSVIVNTLLKKYPTKKWVLDGGGLQEVDLELITPNCILTPHKKEFLELINRMKWEIGSVKLDIEVRNREIISLPTSLSSLALLTSHFARILNCTILLKGPTDIVCQGKRCTYVEGGNPGMTKGGTGDVLAGLVAALYCKNDSWTAAAVGSWVNKTAGDELFKKVGIYFNAADLVKEAPKVLREIIGG